MLSKLLFNIALEVLAQNIDDKTILLHWNAFTFLLKINWLYAWLNFCTLFGSIDCLSLYQPACFGCCSFIVSFGFFFFFTILLLFFLVVSTPNVGHELTTLRSRVAHSLTEPARCTVSFELVFQLVNLYRVFWVILNILDFHTNFRISLLISIKHSN